MTVTIKKSVYESSTTNLLKSLSSVESTDSLIRYMLEYRRGLKNADKLNEEQRQSLTNAKTLLAEEKIKVVAWLGQAAWQALASDAGGTEIQKAKHTVQSLDGDGQVRRNAFALDNAPGILGISGVAKHIGADGIVTLGEKTNKRASSSSNGERPSLRKVLPGQNFWWKHSSIWYQIVGCADGIRLFNLITRIELTELGKLPTNASAAQRFVTSWADAFRGYVAACPQDVTALTESELMADVESA